MFLAADGKSSRHDLVTVRPYNLSSAVGPR